MKYVRIYDIPVPKKPNFVPFVDAKVDVGYKDRWGNIRIRTGKGYIKLHADGRIFGNSGNRWPTRFVRPSDEMQGDIKIVITTEGQ
jgi:hypothetical protein